MDNYIGTYPFIQMSMLPLGSKQTTEIESRPGVDGTYIWLTGNRGEPFEVITVVDTDSVAASALLISHYEELIGTPQQVTFAGTIMPKLYAVLNVRPIPELIRQTVVGIGGTGGLSYGICAAQWTLVATDQDYGG